MKTKDGNLVNLSCVDAGNENKITIYFPYYNQPEALKFNLDYYSSLDEELKNKFNILVVDDGSQREQAFHVVKTYEDVLNLSLYKIHVDIPWNMGAANNIAFKDAETEWIVRTDIDWFCKEQKLRKVLNMQFEDGTVYFFRGLRVKDKPPFDVTEGCNHLQNVYILNKKKYWETGGYNEYLCGNYGDDFEFRPRLFKKAKHKLLDIPMYTPNVSPPKNYREDPHSFRGKFSTEGLSRDYRTNWDKAHDPNRPFLTFQNSYTKLI